MVEEPGAAGGQFFPGNKGRHFCEGHENLGAFHHQTSLLHAQVFTDALLQKEGQLCLRGVMEPGITE